MESNNIIAAPQIDDVSALFAIWRQRHVGSLKAFYRFMTSPSLERDDFINSLENYTVTTFNGKVARVTISVSK